MRTDSIRRVLIPSAALLLLAIALMLAGLGLTGAAQAAPTVKPSQAAVTIQTRDMIVEFGDPVDIAANERVEAVVSFGGDVTVAGTVTSTIVAFGGDVRLLPTASVGGGLTDSQDPSVFAMGGTITVEEGAQVNGTLERVSEGDWSQLLNIDVPRPDYTWGGFSFFGWLVQTAVFLVLGLVAAALLPKQMLAIGRTLAARPGGSLGWGALVFFIIVPAAAIVLAISIIGILVLIPALVVVPLFYFFAGLSVAAFIAQRLLSKGRQGGLMLATAVGVVVTTIISQVPFGGALAVLALTLFGTGAAVLALLEWRKNRRTLRTPAPAGGPAGGPGYGPYGQLGEPAGAQGYGAATPAPYATPPQYEPLSPAPAGDAFGGARAPGAPDAAAGGAAPGEGLTAVIPPAAAETATVVTPPAAAGAPTAIAPPSTPEAVTAVPSPSAEPPAVAGPSVAGESGSVTPPAATAPASEPEGPPRRRFGKGAR
jgi:hypothetical protein